MNLAMRRVIWRLGRKLYMWARKDEPNNMASNGEFRLQRLAVGNAATGARLVAFDVGARVGDWSRSMMSHAAERPGGIEVHAFEPVPESRQAISESCDQQIRAGQLKLNAIALSDSAHTVPIYVPHAQAGTSTLHPDSRVDYERVLEVATSTVDEYCRVNAVSHIDLLKIDTEGNDLRVLRGASDMLRRGAIGVLQFEYNFRWIHARGYLKDVFDLIGGTPYRLAKVCSTALEIYVEWNPELERFFETNYALVHESLVEPMGCEFFRIGSSNAIAHVPRTT